MFLVLNFDLWPFTKSSVVMRQPLLGALWTVTVLLIAVVAFNAGVRAAGMDVVSFLVRVPVPFIFGTIIVLNMVQATLFSRFTQPMKGVLKVAAAATLGKLLSGADGRLAKALDRTLNTARPSDGSDVWPE